MVTSRAWGFFWASLKSCVDLEVNRRKEKMMQNSANTLLDFWGGNNLLFVSIYHKKVEQQEHKWPSMAENSNFLKIGFKLFLLFFCFWAFCFAQIFLGCSAGGQGEKWGWSRQVKIGQSLFFSISTNHLQPAHLLGAQGKIIHADLLYRLCQFGTSSLF